MLFSDFLFAFTKFGTKLDHVIIQAFGMYYSIGVLTMEPNFFMIQSVMTAPCIHMNCHFVFQDSTDGDP